MHLYNRFTSPWLSTDISSQNSILQRIQKSYTYKDKRNFIKISKVLFLNLYLLLCIFGQLLGGMLDTHFLGFLKFS